MEIYDESELTELELIRQKNIIDNHKFMTECGLKVKPLVYVKRSKTDLIKVYAYKSSDDEDEQDEEWVGSSTTTTTKKKDNTKFVPDFRKAVKNPVKYLENNNNKKKLVEKSKSATTTKLQDVSETVVVRRKQPQRSSVKNYTEDEEDHYVFCEQCETFMFGECTIHTYACTDLQLCDNTKALATLPDGLEIRESLIPNAGLGVFATKMFDIGVRFGPYQGKKVRKDIPRNDVDTSYMWEIMNDGIIAYYINGKDENEGNWMRYINCSRIECEQNLVAFQFCRDIYYRSYKKIKPGDELLVWYGEEYAKDLGINLLEDEESDEIECTADLKNHTITHTNKKLFECNVCEYKSSLSNSFKRHMMSHTGEKPFACTVCEYKCSHKRNLKDHMRMHTGEKPYACTVCEFKYLRKHHLKDHMMSHTGEKPFACTVCEYKCSRSHHLKDHMRLHTGEKPFACSICEYKCSHKHRLKDHMRMHTGEKPYACTLCEYKCSHKHKLKYHMMSHTGEKPFACTVCEYKCSQSSTLKRHMKIHNNGKVIYYKVNKKFKGCK